MSHSRVHDIKKAQKESYLLRTISQLFMRTAIDDPRLKDIFINRVDLSPDKGTCTVLFYTVHGKEYFRDILEVLKLYKPSMRKALSQELQSRYTPELVFKFDEQFEKQQKIEQLIEKVKVEEE